MSLRRTSEEWLRDKPNLVVLDPDGWDREDYTFSFFEELITEAEFEERVSMSTCLLTKPQQP